MDMTFRIRGIEKLLQKMRATTRTAVITRALTDGAFHLQHWVQRERLTGPRPRYLGVVSGRLRSSITVQAARKDDDNYVAKIGTNVIYAAIHEFGMEGRMPARPFLRPAIEERENQRIVLQILENNIKRAIEVP